MDWSDHAGDRHGCGQAALDQYATARPAKLLEPMVTAKQAKKAERQKKKK